MATNPQKKDAIHFKDIFSLPFLRAFFKSMWLFFPAILFLILAWAAFWQLSQGKDLLERTLENQRIFVLFIVAEVFWTYITWYTCYIIAKIKLAALPQAGTDKDVMCWRRMLIQMPRLIAYSCLTIMILAFFKLWFDESFNRLFILILLLSPFIYLGIYDFWSSQADRADDDVKYPDKESKIKFLNKFRHSTQAVLAVALLIISFFPSFILLMILLIAFQVGLVLLLVFKKKMFIVTKPVLDGNDPQPGLMSTVKKHMFDNEELFYTRVFLFILIAGLIFYITTIFSIPVSVKIGAVPFILFAFGMLLILGNGVSFLSVLYRINLHMLALLIAFITGLFYEPHYTTLPEKKVATSSFSNRQTLAEYFKNWVEQRKALLDDSTDKTIYPVYFALADGGASRSGYWSASVMASLDSQTNGKLSSHLFCLSGASGGSVGNAAYFNLLRARQIDSTVKTADGINIVQDYLETDFLTFTIARMLGPDVFRYVLPLWFVHDRADALSRVMETGSGETSRLYKSMSTRFSEIITQKNIPYSLPILCINTTRMQDGIPAVISNISINDPRFNKRVDLLNLLGENRDIKMSSAVVLGASFPYLSPAGRINESKKDISNYFVDGGYFDNSGSGVVSEMINILLQDSLYKKYQNKLQFYVLHATNSPQGDNILHTVNPLVNDLAAPVKTLVGAYGTQTVVNDRRLWNQLKVLYPRQEEHYIKFNLYDVHNKPSYPMDWVISDTALNRIKLRLYTSPEITKMVKEINNKK
jgi:predicted acylesterase/phospholipase RssA